MATLDKVCWESHGRVDVCVCVCFREGGERTQSVYQSHCLWKVAVHHPALLYIWQETEQSVRGMVRIPNNINNSTHTAPPAMFFQERERGTNKSAGSFDNQQLIPGFSTVSHWPTHFSNNPPCWTRPVTLYFIHCLSLRNIQLHRFAFCYTSYSIAIKLSCFHPLYHLSMLTCAFSIYILPHSDRLSTFIQCITFGASGRFPGFHCYLKPLLLIWPQNLL